MCVCRKHLWEVNPEFVWDLSASARWTHTPLSFKRDVWLSIMDVGPPGRYLTGLTAYHDFIIHVFNLKQAFFQFWWLLNLTQLQLAGVILQWSRAVICEQRLEHNRRVTLLQALEDHAASPRVHGGPCACAGAVSVFGWGLRLDKERPRLLLLWHFSNW